MSGLHALDLIVLGCILLWIILALLYMGKRIFHTFSVQSMLDLRPDLPWQFQVHIELPYQYSFSDYLLQLSSTDELPLHISGNL